jgi:hypothetical protein
LLIPQEKLFVCLEPWLMRPRLRAFRCLLATVSVYSHRSAPLMRSQHHLARRTALLGGTMLPAWPLRSVLLSGAALPIWPQRASAFRFGVSSEAPEPDNIFQKILRGEAPADVLDDADGDLFSFRDKNPASTLHFLVIPRGDTQDRTLLARACAFTIPVPSDTIRLDPAGRFIRDASLLTPDDVQLVQRMTEKARELIKREVGDAFDEDEVRFRDQPSSHLIPSDPIRSHPIPSDSTNSTRIPIQSHPQPSPDS